MTKKVEERDALDEEDEAEAEGPEDDRPMSFWDHLSELRSRIVYSLVALIIGCGITWIEKAKLLATITEPFCASWTAHAVPGACNLHFSTPGGSFAAYFNLSLIGGFALAAPVIFYQLWAFVAPGLYAKEKKYVIPFVLASTFLFVSGGYFAFRFALPLTFGYFLGMSGSVEGAVTVTPTIMMEDYIDFVVKILLGFGAIFEIPILFTFLALVGVVNHKQMLRWARYYIFAAFLIAGILTPPDWASQLVMAIPACGLYFMSVGLVFVFQKKSALRAWEAREKEKEDAKKAEEEEKKAAERKAKKRKAKKATA